MYDKSELKKTKRKTIKMLELACSPTLVRSIYECCIRVISVRHILFDESTTVLVGTESYIHSHTHHPHRSYVAIYRSI